jgi:hypothetical protein
MQTFLPYPDFNESARILDYKRLGKQRVETLQILKALILPDYGWKNHPAVKMWQGYEMNLAAYGMAVCREWVKRGYKDTCYDKIVETVFKSDILLGYSAFLDWVTPELCRSHQSNLKRKDSAFYGPIFPDVPDDLPYVWPTQQP